MKKVVLFLCIVVFFLQSLSAQLVITNQGGTASTIAASIIGPGLTLANATISCPSVAYGTFSGGLTTNIGLSNGIILTTGIAANVAQAAGGSMDTDNGTSCSDAQLIALDPNAENDCCILEFDITAQCNQLTIRFAFGSEEYPTFAPPNLSTYNDAFGFFVSGPNPAGGNYVNKNIAMLPNGTITSIDNINPVTNSTYYVNNSGGSTIVFGGFTTSISSSLNLVPCATYHFKLAIADAADHALDSGVMIDFLQCTSPWSATTASTPTGCIGNTGTATATVTGGIGPFTYAWAPSGGTNATATGLAAGAYVCTVNDALACTPPQTYNVTVSSAASGSTVSVPANISYCNGATVPASNFISTPAGGTFAWTNSNTAIGLGAGGVGDQPSFTATNTGTTSINSTISVTPTVAGCIGTPTLYTITVNPIPNVTNSTLTQTICSGASSTLVNLTADIAGATYTWTATATAGVTGFTINGTNTIPVETISTTGITAGTVTYAITPSANGCSGPVVNYTIIVNPIPTVTNSPLTQTICSGTSSALVNLTSSVAGASFAWTTFGTAGLSGFSASGANAIPSETITTTGTSAGTVTYSITPSANTCSGPLTNYTITINPIPILTNTPLNQTVCSGTNSSLVNLTSDIIGATFAWTATASIGASGFTTNGTNTIPVETINTTGTTTETVTYAITPTANACPGLVTNYTINVNPIPNVTNFLLTQTICSGSTSTLVSLTSNVAGASFSWTANATAGVTGFTVSGVNAIPAETITTTGTTAGTVTYVITPIANACPGPQTNYTITVNPIPQVTNTPLIQTICAGANSTLVNLTSNIVGATFSWIASSSGNLTGFMATGTNTIPVQTINSAGNTPEVVAYTVTPLVNACQGPATDFVITVNPTPSITNFPLSESICAGTTSAAVILASNVAGATFTWSATATAGVTGFTAGGTNTIPAENISTTGAISGIVTYAITPAANACTGPVTNYTITVSPLPTGLISGGGEVCLGTIAPSVSIALTGNGPWNITYTDGITSNTVSSIVSPYVISNPGNGNYSITLLSDANCIGTFSGNANVIIDPLPTAFVTGSSEGCYGTTPLPVSIALTGASPWTIVYSDGTSNTTVTTATSPFISTNPPAGNYSVVSVTDLHCIGSSGGSALVIIHPIPVVSVVANPAIICTGATAALQATGGTTYSWTPAVSITGIGSANVSPLTTTIYTVTGSANGCSSAAVVTVTVKPTPVISPISTITACNGAIISSTIPATTPQGSTFSWANSNVAVGLTANGTGNVNSFTGTNPWTLPDSGIVIVNAMLNGCAGVPIQYTIIVNPTPSVNVPATITVCNGDLVASPTISSSTPGSSFIWSNSNTSIGLTSTGAGNIPGFTAINNSLILVASTITVIPSANGCIGTPALFAISVNPSPSVSVAPKTICFGDTTTLFAIPSSPGGSYSWLPLGSTFDSIMVSPDSTSMYTVTYTDGFNCSASGTGTVIVKPLPIPDFTAPPSTSILDPTVNFLNYSINGSSMHWDFGDVLNTTTNTSILQNPKHIYSEIGTYCVKLIVQSSVGCVDSVEKCIVINPEFTFYIPNAFSPNNDGNNDEFFGKGEYIVDFLMNIFDRWGNLIFSSEDLNKHWDGKINKGTIIGQEDVYVYVIKIKDILGYKHQYIGSVTLVK